MINVFVTLCFVVAGVFNVIPAIGAFSNSRLSSLYAIDVTTVDLSLLLRHRAVLFLIVGLLLLAAAAFQSLRLIAGIAGLISMVSFVLLAWSLPEISSSLQRIVTIDIVLSLLLIAGLILDQLAF